MNLTQLRAELEEVDRAGYGECRVSVYPALSEDQVTGRHILDFTSTEYAVYELDVPVSPSGGLVILVFDLAEHQTEPAPGRQPADSPVTGDHRGERSAPTHAS